MAENKQLSELVSALQAQVKDLAARLEEQPKRGPGRPPKED
jgi:hypothetical protein